MRTTGCRQAVFLLSMILVAPGSWASGEETGTEDYPIRPVEFNKVYLSDDFWAPRIRLNHELTIPYAFQQSEETGRVRNFEIAAGFQEGSFCTIYPFDDSDVFKIIEGASYSLQTVSDPELERYLDGLIEKIGAAQEPDGYLYTNRTIMGENSHEWAGSRRWELVHKLSHELYNLGHMYEAAVAHYQATGKRTFLDIAIRSAELLLKDFGWGKEENYPGHQEIEVGLVKLYRVTGKKEYLDLARFFLDVRGPDGEAYSQSHQKVVDQAEAVGHSVRANYMYSGMADIAALTGDQAYVDAIGRIWEDVVSKKLYITGGVGSTSSGEAYGAAYELPNESAYCETCASIANVFWNHRMFLLHGEAKYMDVLERTLYNGLLSGLGQTGDRFFYPNPLKSRGQHKRSAWFGCACCPSNLTRFLPSIPGYVYASDEQGVFVNLYVQSRAEVELDNRVLQIEQETNFPWSGEVSVRVRPSPPGVFRVGLRVPGWVREEVVPGDLYSFTEEVRDPVRYFVNGEPVTVEIKQGFAFLERFWQEGDHVRIEWPMAPRLVKANPKVKADVGAIAIQRGPVVYALEWPDNPDERVLNLVISEQPNLAYRFEPNLLNGIGMVFGDAMALWEVEGGTVQQKVVRFQAIPYYAWANRGPGEMTIWIPEKVEVGTPAPLPSKATTATATGSDPSGTLESIKDQWIPERSSDRRFGYIHWWPRKDTKEWLEYRFPREEEVSSAGVFWFDDEENGGGCRVPSAWKLYYRDGSDWREVQAKGSYGTVKDKINRVEFDPVRTSSLRLEVQLPQDYSTGVLEWLVD